jgi:competence protein ComEC
VVAGQGAWETGSDLSTRRQWPPRSEDVAPVRAAYESLLSAFASAADNRRLFVLLPFSLIVGLIIYALLPQEPDMIVLALGALAALLLLLAAGLMHSLIALRLFVQVAAFWIGFCLLPAHAALFGTPMLAFP